MLTCAFLMTSQADQGTLVFTSADSGADGAPVTWQAYPSGAKVVRGA